MKKTGCPGTAHMPCQSAHAKNDIIIISNCLSKLIAKHLFALTESAETASLNNIYIRESKQWIRYLKGWTVRHTFTGKHRATGGYHSTTIILVETVNMESGEYIAAFSTAFHTRL